MRKRSLQFLSVLALGSVVLTGCGSEEPEQESSVGSSVEAVEAGPGSSSSSSASATSEASESGKAPWDEGGDSKPSDAQKKAIQEYLVVRENAESSKYKDVQDWKGALKGVTTDAGYKLSERFQGTAGSAARALADEHKLQVTPSLGECAANKEVSTKGKPAFTCPLSNVVVGEDGKALSLQEQSVWPYAGPQQKVVLVLSQQGSSWLVDADMSGLAG